MNAVIAVNPQQMQEAQATTTGWIEVKLAAAKKELSLAEEVYNSLQRNKLRTQPASAQINRARRRIAFYEKVKAALDAGYYIIPPFNVQLFAIRTDKLLPSAERGERNWDSDHEARRLPVGEGRYVHPAPTRDCVDVLEKTLKDGSKTEINIYENTDWRDMELPIKALKPEVIEATGRALGLKIFDALGIAPAYRSADPLIVGQIRRPEGNDVLTFFVAWWLNQEDL